MRALHDSGPAGLVAPAPLQALLDAAAGRKEILGLQNALRLPGELAAEEDGWVPFADENQGSWVLLYGPGEPDPPVRFDDYDRERLEEEPLSGVLLQFLLLEAALCSPYGAAGFLSGADVDRVTEGLRRVPLAPATWSGAPHKSFAGPGLIVTADTIGDDEWFLSAGARTSAPLAPLQALDLPWERFDS